MSVTNTKITVDDLVYKLRTVRKIREFKRHFNIEYDKISTIEKEIKPNLNLNTTNNAFSYINHYFMLGIEKNNIIYNDHKIIILWDFANIQRELVYERLKLNKIKISQEI
jgi:uncharacterized protein (DUF433 family)